jgi:cellulose synthase/poly-beta-1,6-N-acetylglucosamine synthase-like glycosyltransferase
MRVIVITLHVIMAFFFTFTIYQVIYGLISIFKKPKTIYKASTNHKYAVLIAARNEEAVIGNLIDSIKNQNYPQELLNVFVLADNCTDKTKDVALEHGAEVIERFNQEEIGKGYALNYLLKYIDKKYGYGSFDGYLVFDADNLLDENYIKEMNNYYDSPYRIVTSYRNSKNFDSNWLSAGTGLFFIKDAQFLNYPRNLLKGGALVSGCGFMFKNEVVIENDGWPFHSLVEDAEFSLSQFLKGDKIGYAKDAIFYDEQPTKFSDSWNQRLRWTKGFYQMCHMFLGKLIKKVFKGSFNAFDFIATYGANYSFWALLICNIALPLINIFYYHMDYLTVFMPMIIGLVSGYVSLSFVALILFIRERKRINCSSNAKKIWYIITFPLFVMTYMPISFIAAFMRVKWKQIPHTAALTNEDLMKQRSED